MFPLVDTAAHVAEFVEIAPPRAPYAIGSPPAVWPTGAAPMFHIGAYPGPISATDTAVELVAAIDAWSRVPCSGFRAQSDIALSLQPSGVTPDDAINTVFWHPVQWPPQLVPKTAAQTVVTLGDDGSIADVDIHLNAVDFKWSLDGKNGTIDLRSVLTHEMGHALGLGHSPVLGATMAAGYPGGTSWRSLEVDDKEGVCSLYPGAGAPGCAGGACPVGLLCVGDTCQRPFAQGELCSPCDRTTNACEGAGDGARCIDIAGPTTVGRVCGRPCAVSADCPNGFQCAATTEAGDLQCVSLDQCASGANRCATSTDCPVGVCSGGACVGEVPSNGDAGPDASLKDGGSLPADPGGQSAGGGCSSSEPPPPSTFYGVLFALFALTPLRLLRRSFSSRKAIR